MSYYRNSLITALLPPVLLLLLQDQTVTAILMKTPLYFDWRVKEEEERKKITRFFQSSKFCYCNCMGPCALVTAMCFYPSYPEQKRVSLISACRRTSRKRLTGREGWESTDLLATSQSIIAPRQGSSRCLAEGRGFRAISTETVLLLYSRSFPPLPAVQTSALTCLSHSEHKFSKSLPTVQIEMPSLPPQPTPPLPQTQPLSLLLLFDFFGGVFF